MSGGSAVLAEASPSVDEVLPEKTEIDVLVGDTDLQRAQHLARRLRFVLFDLGLDHKLPSWFSATEFGLDFAPLNHKDAQLLIKTLEDVVGFRASSVPRSIAGQQRLW